jgi:hypothetical protein
MTDSYGLRWFEAAPSGDGNAQTAVGARRFVERLNSAPKPTFEDRSSEPFAWL